VVPPIAGRIRLYVEASEGGWQVLQPAAFQPQPILEVGGHAGIGTLENLMIHTFFHTGNSTRLQASLLPQPDLRVVSSLILIMNV
jgi:hypothetical protein